MTANGAGHRARKRFGQNFLVDASVVDRIVSAIAPGPEDAMVEIGPGHGALTESLLARCPALQVVELDRDLIAPLRSRFANYPLFRVHQGDALKFDFGQLAPSATIRVVGNLPYNISTPLLFHLLTFGPKIRDMHFMLQKEVVDRLAAGPGSRAYGRLSVMTQYHCRVEPLFSVPPGAFQPQPKVMSAIVRLRPRRTEADPALDAAFFARLVNTCFQQRRKTLGNALKPLASRERLASMAIALDRRPETLTVAEFVQLSNALRPSHEETTN